MLNTVRHLVSLPLTAGPKHLQGPGQNKMRQVPLCFANVFDVCLSFLIVFALAKNLTAIFVNANPLHPRSSANTQVEIAFSSKY